MHVEPWMWVAFVAFIVAMLAVDLLVLNRHPHVVGMREAALWSGVWVTLGLGFGALVWWWQGSEAGGQYLAGYLIEKSLSVDNIFVFALIFGAFAVPAEHQHRVLFWGVLGALVFRAAVIVAGAALLETFHWTIYVFGGFLVLTGIRMVLTRNTHTDPSKNPALRLMRKVLPVSDTYDGPRFWVRDAGRWIATPLLAVLLVVEASDIVFAVDSIPAVFGVTHETFLVFTSNAFAILGLRALYFLLAGMIQRFTYLKIGLAAVLMFVGVKMLVDDVVHVPIWLSLLVIAVLIGASVVVSLWRSGPTGSAPSEDEERERIEVT